MSKSKEIGKKLRLLRKNRGFTQEEVSKRVGYTISRSTLSNYEIGRRMPRLDHLRKLSAVYGVSLEFFDMFAKDEAFELISRAKDVFESNHISDDKKEEIYQEFMQLYLNLKSKEKQKRNESHHDEKINN